MITRTVVVTLSIQIEWISKQKAKEVEKEVLRPYIEVKVPSVDL